MSRALVCQTGTVFSRKPEIPLDVSATSSLCLLRGCVGPAGFFPSFTCCWKPGSQGAGVKLLWGCSSYLGSWGFLALLVKCRLKAASQPRLSLVTSPDSPCRKWTPLTQQLPVLAFFLGQIKSRTYSPNWCFPAKHLKHF